MTGKNCRPYGDTNRMVHQQVLLDYGCFTDYVRSNFSIGPSNYIEKYPDEDDDDEVEFD